MASGRVVGIVVLCAAAAVAALVGGTVLMSRHESTIAAGAITKPLPGKPRVELELAGRKDPEAFALAQAQKLLDVKPKKPAQAAAIFRRYTSPEARLGLAFAEWTGPESLAAVQAIVASFPQSAAAQFNLGLADFQAGRRADAFTAWQQTVKSFPDSPYAVDALDVINPGVLPGLPPIVFDPAGVPAIARAQLEQGVHYWDRKHVVSARRDIGLAAKLAPQSSAALVAAAVARFSPARPFAPFHVLGPLTAEFPRASTVRLHLGLLLIWTKQFPKAEVQLRLAAAEQTTSIYAKQARALLQGLGHK